MFLKKIIECFFVWHVPSDFKRLLKESDVLIGQSFGVRANNNPGKSNEKLSCIAKEIQDKYSVPLILQWEIAEGIQSISDVEVIRQHRRKGKYLDTYEVIAQANNICKKNGWNRVIMLAHPHHCWRCVMAAEKLGLSVAVVNTMEISYDHLSKQIWTRSPWMFMPRELVARLLYLVTGKI